MRRLVTGAVLAAVLLSPVQPEPAWGQSSALQRRLAAAERLECSFPVLATGQWDRAGEATATVGDATLDLTFFDINTDEGSAEAEGAFGGASFISARYAQGYLHLMQIGYSGPLHITTVLAHQASAGRLLAVHVRLEYTPTMLPGFTSRPEMYVGSCAIIGD
jgi:hypothetical protein